VTPQCVLANGNTLFENIKLIGKLKLLLVVNDKGETSLYILPVIASSLNVPQSGLMLLLSRFGGLARSERHCQFHWSRWTACSVWTARRSGSG